MLIPVLVIIISMLVFALVNCEIGSLLIFLACKTLNDFCTTCNGSVTCTSCSNSKYALGSQCVDSCPYGTFLKQGICTCKKIFESHLNPFLACATLDDYCLGCNGTSHCTECSGGLVALGPMCIDECPPTTYDHTGVCTCNF